MSNNEETIIKTDNEEEVEIKIEETDEKSNKANNENDIKDKSSQPIIENKAVNELNDVERAVIVANAKNGVGMPFFDVKFFGNGKYRQGHGPVHPVLLRKFPVGPVRTGLLAVGPEIQSSVQITDNWTGPFGTFRK